MAVIAVNVAQIGIPPMDRLIATEGHVVGAMGGQRAVVDGFAFAGADESAARRSSWRRLGHAIGEACLPMEGDVLEVPDAAVASGLRRSRPWGAREARSSRRFPP
jgi:hypothetical protein